MIWTTRGGEKISIQELSLEHLQNAIAYLEKKHEALLVIDRGKSCVVDQSDGPDFELEDEQRFPQLYELRAELKSRMESENGGNK